MKRRVRIREVHDLEFLGWILLIFLGLLLAWASRAAALPDNRAWEMVSPLNKGGGEIAGINALSSGGIVQASPDGNAITYTSVASFGDPQGAPIVSQYLAGRSSAGWSTQNITAPTTSQEFAVAGEGGPYKAFSTDLSSALQIAGPLSPGLPAEYQQNNFNLRDNETGTFQSLLTSPPHGAGEEILSPGRFSFFLREATPGLEHVGISSTAALTANATYIGRDPQYENLYDWSKADQQFHAVNILPGVTNNETAPEFSRFGDGAPEYGVISNDGSQAFWTYDLNGEHQTLYVRENPDQPQSPLAPTPTGSGDLSEGSTIVDGLNTTAGVFAVGAEISGEGIRAGTTITSIGSGTLTLSSPATATGSAVALSSVGACIDPLDACTVQVDASRGSGESGHGEFLAATPDGSKVFFTDENRLTSDSTAIGLKREELYEFNIDTNELTDLTLDHNPGDVEGALVKGVLGTSTDGSYVYFAAGGVLGNGAAEGAKPQGACNSQCNVYVSHNGQLKFISALEVLTGTNWARNVRFRTARVSADGSHLLFNSTESLTGYDNTIASGSNCGSYIAVGSAIQYGANCPEVYLYNANTAGLTCASCNPSGARPQGPSSIPDSTGMGLEKALYQSRVLSDEAPSADGANDGTRVFFDSGDGLVPQDKNAREDVYEWEADGTGSCRSEAQNGGCVSLISGGTYSADSSFVDASQSGSNVFFITGQELVGQDTDELGDLYDAREDGGIVVPPAAPVCSGTGCQGVPPAPPIFATPSSVTFNGVGNFEAPAVKKAVVKTKKAKPKPNVKACRKGLVRKRGKCARRAAAKRSSARAATGGGKR